MRSDQGETGGEGSTLIFVSGVRMGGNLSSGVYSLRYGIWGDFEGVKPKLSRGFDSGGDIKFAIDGNRVMFDGPMVNVDGYVLDEV